MSDQYKEKRASPRVPLMVKVKDCETGKEFEYFSKEVSYGGIFLECEEKGFHIGQNLSLEFTIPGTNQDLKAKGKVVHLHSQDAKTHHKTGIGIHFQDMDGRSEEQIKSYVDTLVGIREKLS